RRTLPPGERRSDRRPPTDSDWCATHQGPEGRKNYARDQTLPDASPFGLQAAAVAKASPPFGPFFCSKLGSDEGNLPTAAGQADRWSLIPLLPHWGTTGKRIFPVQQQPDAPKGRFLDRPAPRLRGAWVVLCGGPPYVAPMTVQTATTAVRSPGATSALWRTELAETIKLATPMAATQLGQITMMPTDRAFLGRLGDHVVAAAALAHPVLFAAYTLGMGLVSAVAPLASQAFGARKPRFVRRAVRVGVWAAVLAGAPLTTLQLW